jgi:DNA-binding GntR family transcriptional regulator
MLRHRSQPKSPRRKSSGLSDEKMILRRPDGLTHGERLRIKIADQIVGGELVPGTSLDETTLAERYGVSRTPVREALRELAAAGLVVHRPHRGAVVAAVTEERLLEMFQVMADLESLCAGYAAEHITPIERQTLVDLHADAKELVRLGDLEAYTEANDVFHNFIYSASHNGFLAETALNVRRRVSPFRRVQFRTLGRLAISHAEHDRVVQAILRGDKDAAAREMRTHLGSVHHAYQVFSEAAVAKVVEV